MELDNFLKIVFPLIREGKLDYSPSFSKEANIIGLYEKYGVYVLYVNDSYGVNHIVSKTNNRSNAFHMILQLLKKSNVFNDALFYGSRNIKNIFIPERKLDLTCHLVPYFENRHFRFRNVEFGDMLNDTLYDSFIIPKDVSEIEALQMLSYEFDNRNSMDEFDNNIMFERCKRSDKDVDLFVTNNKKAFSKFSFSNKYFDWHFDDISEDNYNYLKRTIK